MSIKEMTHRTTAEETDAASFFGDHTLTKAALFLSTRDIDRVCCLRKAVEALGRADVRIIGKSDVFEAADEPFLPRTAGVCLFVESETPALELVAMVLAFLEKAGPVAHLPQISLLGFETESRPSLLANLDRAFLRIPLTEAAPQWRSALSAGDDLGIPCRITAL